MFFGVHTTHFCWTYTWGQNCSDMSIFSFSRFCQTIVENSVQFIPRTAIYKNYNCSTSLPKLSIEFFFLTLAIVHM